MTLTATDLAVHEQLGIPPDLLTRARVERVDDLDARQLLSTNRPGNLAGIVFPYLHPITHHVVTRRLRRDHPEVENGKPKAKYLSAYGDHGHLYFPPDCAHALTDVSVRLYLVEAEKSVLSLTAAGAFAIGTSGCWGWKGTVGKVDDADGVRVDEKGPLPDLNYVHWPGREVVIAFDANAATNAKVQAARRALATELTARGATVTLLDVPAEPGVNGPDDYIGLHGAAAFFALLDGAGSGLVLDPNDPLASARAFARRHHTVDGTLSLRHQSSVFLGYTPAAGAYLERDEPSVRAELYRFLESAERWAGGARVPFQPTRAKVENVLDALRAVANLPETTTAPCWLQADPGLDPLDIMACPNGLLDVPQRTLRPPSPHFFTRTAIECPYTPAVTTTPTWIAFLASIWGDDADSITTLQEIFGYALTPDTTFQKIFMIVGPRRSGKGTLGRVLARTVGPRNVCSPTLAAFGRDFGKQGLIGKSLAIIADARVGYQTDTSSVAETLLSVSGEDGQTIPRKFLPDWHGTLSTRFLLLTNELPRLPDISEALAGRFIVLALQQSFYGREDRSLFAQLVPELPGILNWALEGRDRLYARGYFQQPTSAQELMQAFSDLGSPEATFLRAWTVPAAGAQVSTKKLFRAWDRWCEENGRDRDKPGTAQSFGRNVRAVFPWITIRQIGPRGAQDRYWIGLQLLDTPAERLDGLED